ncbi:MAG TPA: winged helix-turn-helix domain-containing protein [Candidatus Dormibacteraeota bacterium]|nr:winged helix-turn-helix domain-containing protein [Candidatus Dormibacteraeota bacterium]
MPDDRLLEGEDPQTIYPHDARHWIAVYREMIDFKEELLARVEDQLQRLPKAARSDVIDNDITLIHNQLERYRRRIEFWYSRQWELEGLEVDPETRVVTYRERSVRLTKRELELLTMLVRRSPQFITARQLLVQAWHDSRLPEETLRTYIVRLRGKVAELGVGAEIVNRPRRGYALVFAERTAGGARPRA